ncbi:MAG: tRNA (adenosine(37)-N6)-threonylcarbamoyltransferase complex dimerization subunit type 1 TsaB [Bacteroidales bacterium]|jgi:tRNA threonylcarbamoyladenosine biosynthesis protein TsaB|nr:tRNA (adenosine(37)-N6)-threonylcarbamoyltransferase complex dimerization subunit type 1 TsaB [Bacteroidales bacterium]
MSYILNIETSAETCSVALSENGKLIKLIESQELNSHSKELNLFIEEILKTSNISYKDLKALAVSYGPGSYTGLRIGMSTAKAICYAHDIPLICLSSLQILANALKEQIDFETDNLAILPLLDARRMEVYVATFDINLNFNSQAEAMIVDEKTFDIYKDYSKVVIGGSGAEKCLQFVENDDRFVFYDVKLSSKYMPKLAEYEFQNKNFADLAYSEPFYLKEYKAIVSKVKGLHD